MPIQKIAISIMVWGFRTNKHITDQYAIADIYILAKNNQEQKVIAYI